MVKKNQKNEKNYDQNNGSKGKKKDKRINLQKKNAVSDKKKKLERFQNYEKTSK